jgi:hypothetical protein
MKCEKTLSLEEIHTMMLAGTTGCVIDDVAAAVRSVGGALAFFAVHVANIVGKVLLKLVGRNLLGERATPELHGIIKLHRHTLKPKSKD